MATHRNPRYLLKILNSFDELYAILSLLVERHFLRTYGGSFTENFYGLKRERALRIKGGEAPRTRLQAPDLMRETLKLRDADVWKNVAVLVGLPYVKRKLDESFEIYGSSQSAVIQMGPNYRRDDLPPNPTLRQRLFQHYKWFIRKIYPSVNAAYYFSLLMFNLAYLYDNTKYSSPLLWLIGTRIRRMSEADYRAIAAASTQGHASSGKGARPGAKLDARSSIFSPRNIVGIVLPKLLSSLKLLLPTSIFALKFLEWWHTSNFAQQLSRKTVEGLDLPPPIISGASTTMDSPETNAPNGAEQVWVEHKTPTAARNTVALADGISRPRELKANAAEKSTEQISSDPNKSLRSTSSSQPPVSSTSHLPIFTVPPPAPSTSSLCPICKHPIQTPTSAQTGYVFCYTCIFKWVDGTHEKQAAFMSGHSLGAEWEDDLREEKPHDPDGEDERSRSKEGEWENGKGRCAVTGRRVLGGTDGLRRLMV